MTQFKKIWTKLPVVAIERESNSFLNNDFSKWKMFRINCLSFEGVEREKLELEINNLSRIIDSLQVPVPFIIQTTYRTQYGDMGLVSRKRALLHRVPDTIRQIYEQSIDQDMEKIFPLLENRAFYLTIIVKLPPVKGKELKRNRTYYMQERDKSLGLLSDLLVSELKARYDIEEVSCEEAFKVLYSCANPLSATISNTSVENIYDFRTAIFNSDVQHDVDSPYFLRVPEGFISVLSVNLIPRDPEIVSRVLSQIDFPYIYNFTMLQENQEQVIGMLQTLRTRASILRGKSAIGMENQTKVNEINEMLQDISKSDYKYGINRVYGSIIVFDKDRKNLESKINHIKSEFATVGKGIGLYQEWLSLLDSFIYSLPGCATKLSHAHFMISPITARFLPMRSAFTGAISDTPVSIFKNRYNNIVNFNPFSETQNRWSGIVVGPSGSGKSYLVNKILFDLALLDPIVCVIDMASDPSYEPLTELFGGTYINVSVDERYRVNLFDLRVGHNKPVGSKELNLYTILTHMITNGTEESLHGEKKSVLNRALNRLYSLFFHENPRTVSSASIPEEYVEEVTGEYRNDFIYWLEYRDFYLKKFAEHVKNNDYQKAMQYFRKAEMAQNFATPTLSDFVRVLSTDPAVRASQRDREIADEMKRGLDFYIIGSASKMFNGVTLLSVKECDVYTFYLGRLTDPEILSLTLLCYRDFFFRKAVFLSGESPEFLSANPVFKSRLISRKKVMLYDEFHNIKNCSNVIMSVLDRDSRQSRTLGMAIWLATQKIQDIAGDKSRAFLNSASNKILTRIVSEFSSTSMEDIASIKEILGLNRETEDLITSLVLKPGEYGEALFILDDIGTGIVRYYPTALRNWVSTTHNIERSLRDAVYESLVARDVPHNVALHLTISALCEMYPEGLLKTQQDVDVSEVINRVLQDSKIRQVLATL